MYFTMYVLCDESVFGPMQYATVKFPLFGSCIEKSRFILFLIFFFFWSQTLYNHLPTSPTLCTLQPLHASTPRGLLMLNKERGFPHS